jgi:hypothetical protein
MSEHDHGEEYPRVETTVLVGEALAAETRRWRLQVPERPPDRQFRRPRQWPDS